ncbi:MAG: 1,4-dihydroxy-2-naphthoate polyprenyltransferase [Candidatus Omnitrophica bacterium]|nr:1,4-dihydroxy-2-naphthoate polyprenyltransferase [Candidatus Omnitrophota bacterium]MCB9722071.1 1,4-dihydroxy-2-naphthoate polyprenyltransferase [Candidatus Omnitrophota bacterium]
MTSTAIKNWMLACRPKTLPAAVAPVVIGTAMAFGDGLWHWPTALVCLLTAVTIQIGTNLANDYYDFKKGTDTAERVGPVRVTQAGLIKPETVRNAFAGVFAVTMLGFLILVQRGGWPIGLLGVVCILSGIFYTAGPKPLGYLGLGDLFVLVFFGPVAVGGTYLVQTYELNYAVLLAGLGPGLISVAILAVNNYRDIDGDRRSGKKTLAVRFGRTFGQYEYAVSLMLAALLPVLIYMLIHDHVAILVCSVISVLALPGIRTVFGSTDGARLNATLAFTGKILLIYSALFSVGWIL